MAHFSSHQNVATPSIRIQTLNPLPYKTNGKYVLYWMVSSRRTTWNFGLQRACEISAAINKPLLVFEALRVDYPWACHRFHQFVLDGMRDNQSAFQQAEITYFPYIEPHKNASKGLLHALCEEACVLISDDFPCFFLPRMQEKVASTIPIHFEIVDSNGILPLRATDRSFTTAASFRRFLQKNITPHLHAFPKANALHLARKHAPLNASIVSKWTPADAFLNGSQCITELPIDQSIKATALQGGEHAAQHRLQTFLTEKLSRYQTDRNSIKTPATTGLSPYFHFGHISAHQVIDTLLSQENWSIPTSTPKATGSRTGWWGMSPPAESFLDQVITWRELGYVFTHHHPATYHTLSSLPEWAKKTIKEHKNDPRSNLYTLEELALSKTHDPVWNAAQTQLRTEGHIHNYLRMLWGKKIYEWSKDAETAIQNLIELNNRYALDGRNPNSYSGIFWVVGRFDRAWGPVRPIFGKLRYMTSASTQKKLRLQSYLERYSS